MHFIMYEQALLDRLSTMLECFPHVNVFMLGPNIIIAFNLYVEA